MTDIMFFKTYNVESFSKVFFKSYLLGGLFLSVLSTFGFFTGAGFFTTLAGILFILVASLLSLNKRFRSSPLSPLFCLFTFIFLSIPVWFILFEGEGYIIGNSVAGLPFEQSEYQESRALGFLYLLTCWVVVWFGMTLVKCRKEVMPRNIFSLIRVRVVLLVGIIVAVATVIDAESIIAVKLGGAEHVFSLMAFIFLDQAYLVLAGVILFTKSYKGAESASKKNAANALGIIFVTFVCVNFIAGSKAAFLVVFMLLVLCPYYLSTQYKGATVISLQPKYLLMLIGAAPVLFYVVYLKRLSYATGVNPDLFTLWALATEIQPEVIYSILESICYRLAWGGLDQFLLIFQSFVVHSYDHDTAINFATYLAKNTLNLLLPGTPFHEAYAPSSQLFSAVIQKKDLISEFDKEALIISLNTQPYTFFGVFTVLFGIAAPVFLYVFTMVFAFTYKSFQNVFLKAIMLYFFSNILSSFGFEVAIGSSANLLVSILVMYLLMKLASRFSFRLLPSRSARADTHSPIATSRSEHAYCHNPYS